MNVLGATKTTTDIGDGGGRIRMTVVLAFFAGAYLTTSVLSIQLARSAPAGTDAREFAGTWEGKFNGKTFVTVKLVAKDGKVSGTVSRFSIRVSPKGGLADASPLEGEDSISETAPEGNVLHLLTKAKGQVGSIAGSSEESIQYDMKLIGKQQAELQIAGAPPGMPAPAPWKLERKPEN